MYTNVYEHTHTGPCRTHPNIEHAQVVSYFSTLMAENKVLSAQNSARAQSTPRASQRTPRALEGVGQLRGAQPFTPRPPGLLILAKERVREGEREGLVDYREVNTEREGERERERDVLRSENRKKRSHSASIAWQWHRVTLRAACNT